MRNDCFIPADELAPALAFNDWLRERVRSILDAPAPRAPAPHAPCLPLN
jgi:hypothetical protein